MRSSRQAGRCSRMDLPSFLAHWEEADHRPVRIEDQARQLYTAHSEASQRLASLKAQGVSFIVPGKDSRGRWMPVYDDARVDDIAALGSEIEQTGKKIKSICNDIEAFLKLSGGRPTVSEIANERNALLSRVRHCEKHAAVSLKKALDRDPHTSPAVLMQRADIAEAYNALKRAQEETKEPLAVFDGQLGKLHAILNRYAAT